MKLRNKVLLTISITWAIFLVSAYIGSRYILIQSFLNLEQHHAAQDVARINQALDQTVSGRYLSPDVLKQIANSTNLSFQVLPVNEITASTEYTKIYLTILNNHTGTLSKPVDDNNIQTFSVIRDIYHKPIGMLQITDSRAIYHAGLAAIRYFMSIFIILSIVFMILMQWLIRALVIDRLERLNTDVENIRDNTKFGWRVDASGHDELSSLAASINTMMNIIQTSHEKLEYHVEERTQELQQTNVQLQQEILERKSVEKELMSHKEHLIHLAHYDSLTALPNRVFFNEILNKALSHANRHNKILAILFIDLDRFKKINDGLGHSIGDQVLKQTATHLQSVIRAEDMLARLGGDEFIILLNEVDNASTASLVAEKLLRACALPINLNNHELYVTASIGISIFPNDGTSLEDLQKNADIAMYKAKKSGGNAYQYFTQEMTVYAHEHIKIESALRNALKNNEFTLYYQPKYNLSDGVIIGVEALIRWENAELGIVSPAKFIPLAEETGLIMQIGKWALHEACRANQSWQKNGFQPITVAVNLSPKQFRHQNIAEMIATALAETGLKPDYLELEITETAVMDNVDIAINTMNDIKQMGVHIAIDDFGTGYTSISNLKYYPISILKIDQNFVRGIPHELNDQAITTAIIELAHNLNMKVVAEGVETAEQLQFLADHDCDIVQGYYLSRPLPEQKLLSLMSKVSDFAD